MAEKIRLVHTADLHLGTSFSGLPEQAEILVQEQMKLFLGIIDYCRQNKADLLLVAGDMFEQAIPEQALADSVRDAFQLIPETRIFITPGNHDPACPDSPWITVNWPEHVHVFRSGLERVCLAELNTCIYGAAFCSTAAIRPLAEKSDLGLDLARINILLLHGDLVGSGQSSIYNPVDKKWLHQSGYDYVALGHVHQGHVKPEVLPQSRTAFAYSGCPAGRGFDESGKRGFIAGDLVRVAQTGLSGRGFRVEHDLRQVDLSGRQFKVLDIDVGSCQNQEDIFSGVLEKLQISGENWQRDLYKMILTGALADDVLPATAVLQSRLEKEVFFCKITDRTTRSYNLKALASEHSLMGAFVRSVLAHDQPDWQRLSDEKTQILQTGLKAFEGEVPYREAD